MMQRQCVTATDEFEIARDDIPNYNSRGRIGTTFYVNNYGNCHMNIILQMNDRVIGEVTLVPKGTAVEGDYQLIQKGIYKLIEDGSNLPIQNNEDRFYIENLKRIHNDLKRDDITVIDDIF